MIELFSDPVLLLDVCSSNSRLLNVDEQIEYGDNLKLIDSNKAAKDYFGNEVVQTLYTNSCLRELRDSEKEL